MPSNKPERRTHKTDRPPLTLREVRFAQRCFETGNGYQSYIDAGFPPLVTRNAVDQAVKRLIRKRQIREYMRHLEHCAAEAAKVSVEELATLMANFAKADRRKLYDKRGNILPPDQWPDDVAATIETIESDELLESVPGEKGKKKLKGYTRKVKTASRIAAVAKLMEWKKMLGQDKQDAGKGPPDRLVVSGEANPDLL